jgi:predicted transcriptional regulator
MGTVKLSDELHRHLRKYALLKHQTVREVVAEAVAQHTQYGQRALAVKWVPAVPTFTAQDIEAVIGVGS